MDKRKIYIFGVCDNYGEISPANADQRWLFNVARALGAYVLDIRELILNSDKYISGDIIIYLTPHKNYIKHILSVSNKIKKYAILQGFDNISLNSLSLQARHDFLTVVKNATVLLQPNMGSFDFSVNYLPSNILIWAAPIDFNLVNKMATKNKIPSRISEKKPIVIFNRTNIHNRYSIIEKLPTDIPIFIADFDVKESKTLLGHTVNHFDSTNVPHTLGLIKCASCLINETPLIDDFHYEAIANHFNIPYYGEHQIQSKMNSNDLYSLSEKMKEEFLQCMNQN